ncbi:alpha/beta hydrolase [Fluviicola sp.]|uniref:alpha/beta hydrolase n=1 Tax=Fluviicola sp. TaxID=1917219 RepID=UPI002631D47A|nr:alpha/beta hydrolase [Fluviicola sp.]
MLKILISIVTLLFLSMAFSQKTETVSLDKNDPTKSCYTIIYPDALPWKGCLFLIPGFGENAERVLLQTNLPLEAAKSGLLTIIPSLQDGVLSFGVDSVSQQTLQKIIDDVVAKQKISSLNFFIGGFSIGGSTAIKFAENAKIKPKAVFAIDPPLDFERFYYSALRDLRLTTDGKENQENVYMGLRIQEIMGGTPETALANYYAVSPYSFTDESQTAVKKLVNMPLRIYSEPDIAWWMKERNADLTSMNITDCSAMINELNRLGNQQAVLITTQNKGFRKPDNNRHPHSWSIVDNPELIKWLLQQK